MYRARASRRAALPRIRGSATIVRARARGPKRATDDNGPIIGRSDLPRLRERSAQSRNPARGLPQLPSLGAAIPAARVPGATSAGRPAPGDHQRQPTARLLAGQQSAAMAWSFRPGRSSCAMAAPQAAQPGARRRGWRAGRRGRAGPAPRVTARGLARKPGRRPSGRDACWRPWDRGTRRAREVRRGQDQRSRRRPSRCRSYLRSACLARLGSFSIPRGGG